MAQWVKVFAVQTWGTGFKYPAPCKKLGIAPHTCQQCYGGEDGRSLEITGFRPSNENESPRDSGEHLISSSGLCTHLYRHTHTLLKYSTSKRKDNALQTLPLAILLQRCVLDEGNGAVKWLLCAHETAADLKLSDRETRKTKQLRSQCFFDSISHVPYDPYSTGAMETAQLRKWSWSWWHLAVIQARERLRQEDRSQVSAKLLQEVHELHEQSGLYSKNMYQ